jgi:hypothetical protein
MIDYSNCEDDEEFFFLKFKVFLVANLGIMSRIHNVCHRLNAT